jgi:cobalt-zinc-cadmium efflux system outer membrane protein
MNIAHIWRWMFFLCTSLLFVQVSVVWAEEKNALSLSEAIAKTLEKNPQLKQFYIKRQQLKNDREFSGYRPGYSLGLEVENFSGNGEFSSFDAAETTLALSSVIELGGKRESRLSVMDSRISLFEVDRQIQTVDVLGSLTSIFISGVSIREKIKLSEESIDLHKEIFGSVKKRFQRGGASEAELMRSKAALVEERIKFNALERQLKIKMKLLATFWNSRSINFDALAGDLYIFDNEENFNVLYEKVMKSPLIESYATKARLKQAELKLAQSSRRTNIEWQVGVRQFQETDDAAIVAGLSIPLFSGKRNRGAYNNSLLDVQAVDINKEKAIVTLHQRLYEAYEVRQQAIEAEALMAKEIVPSLEKAVKLILKGYENGRYKYEDLIGVQKELIAAKWQRLENATVAQLNQSIIEQLIAEPLSE